MGCGRAVGPLSLAAVLVFACQGRAPDQVVAEKQVPAAVAVGTFEASGEVTSLDYDAASGLLIAGVQVSVASGESCASVAQVWDARTRELLHTLSGHKQCQVLATVA